MKQKIFSCNWKNDIKKYIILGFSTILVTIIWIDYIFKPIDKAISNYSNSYTTQGDPVIILGLAGFLALSVWFLYTTGIAWISWSIFKLFNLVKRFRK